MTIKFIVTCILLRPLSCQGWVPVVPSHCRRSALATNVSGTSSSSLLDILSPSQTCKVDQMSTTDLAYIGDVVYELMVRSLHVWPPKKTSALQDTVVNLVRAEHQAKMLEQIRQYYTLTDEEQHVVSRGRNSVSGGSRQRRDPVAYQDATALEALIGYLFVADKVRCKDVLVFIAKEHVE